MSSRARSKPEPTGEPANSTASTPVRAVHGCDDPTGELGCARHHPRRSDCRLTRRPTRAADRPRLTARPERPRAASAARTPPDTRLPHCPPNHPTRRPSRHGLDSTTRPSAARRSYPRAQSRSHMASIASPPDATELKRRSSALNDPHGSHRPSCALVGGRRSSMVFALFRRDSEVLASAIVGNRRRAWVRIALTNR